MSDIYNFQFLDKKLSSSGMPTAEQMQALAGDNVRVVINLALPKSKDALPDEGRLVESLGMTYVHIPVEWNNPTTENLEDFFRAMEAHRDEKIHVHCQANYRASAFLMLYRVLQLGWNKADAIAVMEKMWNPEDFPVWQSFIDDQLSRHS